MFSVKRPELQAALLLEIVVMFCGGLSIRNKEHTSVLLFFIILHVCFMLVSCCFLFVFMGLSFHALWHRWTHAAFKFNAFFCRLVPPGLLLSCLRWRSFCLTAAYVKNGLHSILRLPWVHHEIASAFLHTRAVIRLCTSCNRIFFKGSIDCWTCSASTRCITYAVGSGCVRWKKELPCMPLLAPDLVVHNCSCGCRFWSL